MSSGHRFKDGPWEGYLTIGGASNNRKKISLNLKFKDEVDGQGIMDDLGPFELTGVCGGKSPYPCDLKLRFSNIEFVFSGYREGEKNGMFGTWKSSKKVTEWNHATSGSFSLQPSTEPVADLDKMNIDQLVRMGFTRDEAGVAWNETRDIQGAVEFLTNQRHYLGQNEVSSMPGEGGGGRNAEDMQRLIDFGFPSEMAEMALRETGSFELALDLLTG